MSRDKILEQVRKNQPATIPLPEFSIEHEEIHLEESLAEILKKIGGKVFEINSLDEVKAHLTEVFPQDTRKITTITELADTADFSDWKEQDKHSLQDVEAAIIKAHFGVAENGAVWVTDELLVQQVVPFITQHLLVILDEESIVPAMHQAYQRIGNLDYNYGAFIAGPSKTADIEQSLVLGAHGPRTMTVFLMGKGSC